MSDKLEQMFERQTKFMELLRANNRMPEWPLDLTSKPGQRLIKEVIFNTVEELAEASLTLRNRVHRLSDDKTLDIEHYREELGDAWAFLMEVCILSGFDAQQMFDEYCRKNAVVTERLANGY